MRLRHFQMKPDTSRRIESNHDDLIMFQCNSVAQRYELCCRRLRSRLSMVDVAAKSDFIKFYKLVLAVTLQHDEVFNHQVQHPSAPT